MRYIILSLSISIISREINYLILWIVDSGSRCIKFYCKWRYSNSVRRYQKISYNVISIYRYLYVLLCTSITIWITNRYLQIIIFVFVYSSLKRIICRYYWRSIDIDFFLQCRRRWHDVCDIYLYDSRYFFKFYF